MADIVWTLPGYTAGRYPSMEVFELPFMANRAESACRAAWQYFEQFGKEDFATVTPLAFHVHGEVYVHNNKRPITNMAVFRSLKMRAPTRLANKMIAACGATLVALPLPAVKLRELTKLHFETDFSMPALDTAVFVIAMNPENKTT